MNSEQQSKRKGHENQNFGSVKQASRNKAEEGE